MKNKTLQAIIILIVTNFFSYAQNRQKIDSLFKVLKKAKADTTRVNTYADLSYEYANLNRDSSLYFAKLGLNLATKINFKKGVAECYNHIGIVHESQNSYDKAMDYYLKSLIIYEELGNKKGIADCYNNIGIVHEIQGSYDKAIEYYLKSLKIEEELGDKKGMAICYINIGNVHNSQGSYDKAIEYYLRSLKIREELDDKKGKAICYINIGNVHNYQGSYDKAIEYYFKSLKINEDRGDKEGIAICYNNIGNVHNYQGSYDKAIEYYLKSLNIEEELGNKKGMADCYNNIGYIYENQGNYDKAIEYFIKSLKIYEELGNKKGIVIAWSSIAIMHITIANSLNITHAEKIKHYNEAVNYGLKSLNLAKEIKAMPFENFAAKILMKAYKKLGNFKKAMEYAEIFISTNDSMFNEEKTKALANMEARYQNEKKQLEIEKQKILLEKKDTDIKRQKAEVDKQRTMRNAFIGGFALMFLLAFVVFRSYKQKKKANEIITKKNAELESANEEICKQRDEIETQRNEIAFQHEMVKKQKQHIEYIHHELTDSIRYAERIQKAVFPDELYMKEKFCNDFFILLKPKDIVSGDFYFVEHRKHWLFLSVADCTGHGVPGAFMSMLGIAFLNEIIANENVQTASQVLEDLRKYIIRSLQQKGIAGEQKDGMDISFVAINTITNELQFAGANNHLYLIRTNHNHEIIEIKGDNMPVAIYERMDNFTNNILPIQDGDIIYLMSDGYEDQFGGPKGKKFLSKNLKQLLIEHSQKPMNEQKETLNETIENWKNNYETKYEQTDDITIMGIKYHCKT